MAPVAADSVEGYWEMTTTIDWCESNYVASHYIAEWSNTWSNFVTIGVCMFGMANFKGRYAPILTLALALLFIPIMIATGTRLELRFKLA